MILSRNPVRKQMKEKFIHTKLRATLFSSKRFFLHHSPDIRWSRGVFLCSLMSSLFSLCGSLDSPDTLNYLQAESKYRLSSLLPLSLHHITPFLSFTQTHSSSSPFLFQANAIFFCETWYQEKDERLLMFPCFLIHYSIKLKQQGHKEDRTKENDGRRW